MRYDLRFCAAAPIIAALSVQYTKSGTLSFASYFKDNFCTSLRKYLLADTPPADKLALEGSYTYDLPRPLLDDTYNFSYSGLKSHIINIVHNTKQRNEELRKFQSIINCISINMAN